MRTDTSLEARAVEAATAVERFARALLITDGQLSPTVVAYLIRLGRACERVDEEAKVRAVDVVPDWRIWWPDVQTTAARNP
jgi:hypothetical protein